MRRSAMTRPKPDYYNVAIKTITELQNCGCFKEVLLLNVDQPPLKATALVIGVAIRDYCSREN